MELGDILLGTNSGRYRYTAGEQYAGVVTRIFPDGDIELLSLRDRNGYWEGQDEYEIPFGRFDVTPKHFHETGLNVAIVDINPKVFKAEAIERLSSDPRYDADTGGWHASVTPHLAQYSFFD